MRYLDWNWKPTEQEEIEKGFTLVYIITAIMFLIIIISIHECIHVTIYRSYGIDSKVSLADFPTIKTIPEQPCPSEACVLANNQNDILSYTITAVFTGLYLIWLIWHKFNGKWKNQNETAL